MTRKSAFSLLALFMGCAGLGNVFAGTAVVMQPVSASGAHTIVGTDIFLPTGPQRVRLEIRLAGWGEVHLKTVQVRVDSAGFDNGSAPIEHASVPCPSNNSAGHSFCAQTLESGSRCAVGCDFGSTINCRCESGFQNRARTDYAGFGLDQISAVDISTPYYRFGLTTSIPDYVTDPGVSMYFGTFFLDVPANAQGTYVVDMSPSETFLQDQNNPPNNNIPIDLRTAARIIIGDPVAPGSRYVAFEPDLPGVQTAVRVTLSSLYHPGPPVDADEDRDFSAFEGQVRWLGPAGNFPDVAPESTFVAASLQCTPHFADWGSMGTVQVYGDAIIPSSIYTIHQVPIACQDDPNDPTCLGPAQIVHTGQWGDASVPFARSDQIAQPDVADLAEIIDAFRGLIDAAPKNLAHLRGAVPNPATDINYLDVDLAVDAVRGMAYPYPVPTSCP